MKYLILICLLISGRMVAAQEPLSYPDMLSGTREINLSDSLNFDTNPEEITALDSFTVKKWFLQLLPANAGNKFKNRKFSLVGKITSQENFDLLVLLEEKRRSDSTGTQVVYLISAKKTGDYIASLKAAVAGSKKKTGYNISSCLYKDYRIIQDSKITVDNKAINDMAYYKINAGGRFVSHPKFE
ncbi:MAG: hypothetical protein ACT4OJ_04440 [Bacteroidota bacterium]